MLKDLDQRAVAALRFLRPHATLLSAAAVLLWLIFELTSLDQWLIAPYFDPELGGFPMKGDAWLEIGNHRILKYLVIAFGLAGLLLALFGGRTRYACWRRDALFVFVAMLCSTTAVSVLKHFSDHSCPWSLALYGGDAQLFGLFEAMPANPGSGSCFPGGHASAGYSLMALWFPLRRISLRTANEVVALAFILGTLMGWGQMMRGAHFLSHNLWTAWVVWAVTAVIAAGFYALIPQRPR